MKIDYTTQFGTKHSNIKRSRWNEKRTQAEGIQRLGTKVDDGG